jgi:hypothetical protein
LSLAFSSWTIKPWFHTEGKLAAVLITPSLGVFNWMVIYIINIVPPMSRRHVQDLALQEGQERRQGNAIDGQAEEGEGLAILECRYGHGSPPPKHVGGVEGHPPPRHVVLR